MSTTIDELNCAADAARGIERLSNKRIAAARVIGYKTKRSKSKMNFRDASIALLLTLAIIGFYHVVSMIGW